MTCPDQPNRRMRTRMSGGVGGGLREGAPYPVICSSIPKEIQNIPQSTCLGFVDLCVLAACARHGGEFLALNIHELCEKSTSCRKLISLKILILTFWTFPFAVLHFDFLSLDADNVSAQVFGALATNILQHIVRL